MNLNMIRPKNQTEGLLLSKTKMFNRLLNKHIEKLKKRWNLKRFNQNKRFISVHQFRLNEIG